MGSTTYELWVWPHLKTTFFCKQLQVKLKAYFLFPVAPSLWESKQSRLDLRSIEISSKRPNLHLKMSNETKEEPDE